MSSHYLGIDPGKTGCLARVNASGQVVDAIRMPETERDLLDHLRRMRADSHDLRGVIERVSAWPKMGVVSSFSFGRGFGALVMALTAVEIPFDLITPQTWQAAMQCRSGRDKNITKRRAQQLFPSLKVTHVIADGVLIAEYCRRRHQGVGSPAAFSGTQDTHGQEKARHETSTEVHAQEDRRQASSAEGRAAARSESPQRAPAWDGAGASHNSRPDRRRRR